ncbi:MAG TPA: metallophosphoesterase family protein [Polyangiaceae bacterium]|jgi:predicted phosphodiesterase|nr:metallophosphoesterase family protein [Polyangiaceae bacterium]
MLRRAGLIGDIHCEVGRLKQVLLLFRSSNVDTVLAVGDIADGPGDLTEACSLLEEAGALVVAGNHDRWLLEGEMRDLPDAHQVEELTPKARKYLSALPKTLRIESPRGTILLCHGLGEDDMASVRPDDEGATLLANHALWDLIKGGGVRFVVNGHSHRPMLRTIDGLTIMNAGTLHPKHRPVCSIADFETGQMQLYDVEPTRVTTAERWSFERGSRPVQYL